MAGTESGSSAVPSSVGDPLRPLVDALARLRFAAEGDGLTAWDALPEARRAQFADSARKMLHAIQGAGYQVSRVQDRAGTPALIEPATAEGVEQSRQQAERFLRAGEPLLAYNAVQLGLEKWPTYLRLRQLQSLALARSGAVARANHGLRQLREEGHVDAETLGLLARTHKDLG